MIALFVMTALATSWTLTPAQQAQLARGEIIVQSLPGTDPEGATTIRAAAQIAASPAQVYAAMTDCAKALHYVPHLVLCRVSERTADGSQEVIEHRVDAWFLPQMNYRFRARYVRDERIAFTSAGGDLLINDGVWALTPLCDGAATLVRYRVRLKPRIALPGWLVDRSLRRELPALLKALGGYLSEADAARRARNSESERHSGQRCELASSAPMV